MCIQKTHVGTCTCIYIHVCDHGETTIPDTQLLYITSLTSHLHTHRIHTISIYMYIQVYIHVHTCKQWLVRSCIAQPLASWNDVYPSSIITLLATNSLVYTMPKHPSTNYSFLHIRNYLHVHVYTCVHVYLHVHQTHTCSKQVMLVACNYVHVLHVVWSHLVNDQVYNCRLQ